MKHVCTFVMSQTYSLNGVLVRDSACVCGRIRSVAVPNATNAQARLPLVKGEK